MNVPRRVPDLFVEQLAAGELSPERAEEIRQLLRAEPGGLDRLAELQVSNVRIREDLPADQVAREVRARVAEAEVRELQASKASGRGWVVFTVGLLAASFLALRVVPEVSEVRQPLPSEAALTDAGIRLKGLAPSLVVARKRGAELKMLTVDEGAREGDVLQLAYQNRWDDLHGVILSVDGRGVVSLHYPSSLRGDTRLGTDGETSLDHSYELDDAPEHETFLFLYALAPINVTEVMAKARAGGVTAVYTDEQGGPVEVVTRRIPKEAR
jgi:hypothetical protein